jgi:arabinogalactan endo-1,4-beta-galactosidase
MITPTLIPPVMIDAFTAVLNNILSLLFLLMYIPLIYRTVYRIVFEKMSKAKESMRIMGMTDFPYWTSWFAYYTIVNTLLVSGATATLLINVIMR